MALAPFHTSLLDDLFSPFGLMSGFRPGSQQLAPSGQGAGDQQLLRGIPLDILGLTFASGTFASGTEQLVWGGAENDKEFTIKADLPGLKKEDIKVNVDGDVLTLRVEKEQEEQKEEEVEGFKIHRLERTKQFAVRAVRLPDSADTEHIQGKYENGVLTLKARPWRAIPKSEQKARQKQINVE